MSPLAEGVAGIRFGVFEVDVQGRQLRKNGLRIKLQEQPFQLLLCLVQQPGQIVTREQLRQLLWPQDTFVDFDNSLNTAVNRVREALGDSAETPRFIETVPRHGYRFVVPVENLPIRVGQEPMRDSPPAATARVRPARRRIAASIALVIAAGAAVLWRGERARPRPPQRIMLAVLPLENLSGTQDQDYLADGLTEEVTTELGRLDPSHLGVIARTSVTQFKGSRKPVSAIGKELGVQFILEGGARMANGRLRVNLQLIRVGDQSHVWAQSYERDLRDVFTVQREMAEQTAQTLSLQLLPEARQRLAWQTTVSAETMDKYLKGKFYVSRLDRPAALLGVESLEEAIRLSPDFAPAYAALADAYFKLAQPLGPNSAEQAREYLSRSEEAARKALALDESLAEAHAFVAQSTLYRDWDWATAQSEMRRSLELDPNSVVTLRPYSVQLTMRGEREASRQFMRKALELDPVNPLTGVLAAELLFYAHDYQAAEIELRRVLTMDPAYKRAHMILAWLRELRGHGDEAGREYRIAGILSAEQESALVRAFDAAGMTGYHRWWLHAIQEGIVPSGKAKPFHMAVRYAGLGDRDQALSYLDRAAQQHDGNLLLCKVNPWFDSLHSDSRFQILVRRIGIPD